MLGIDTALACDDQPTNGATLFGENRYLTSWVTPDNLEVQEAYKQLVEGIADQRARIVAVWEFVRDIPYVQFVRTRVSVDGRTFTQNDTWLSPDEALKANTKLNCFNKAVLLASLLRQELPADKVFVCLNNVNVDGIDGHAVGYLKLDSGDYLLETTNPGIKSPFLKVEDADIYEAVLFFNDKTTAYIPDISLRMPLGLCCVKWLESYTNSKLCERFY